MVTTFLYLRPRAGLHIDQLDVFSVMNHEHSESDLNDSVLWEGVDQYGSHHSGPLNKIVGGRYEYNTEDERNAGIPIYGVTWDKQNLDDYPILSAIRLGNNPWSSIPEDDRQEIEAGLLSFSIECDYQTPEGLGLKGVTFWNNLIDLHLSEGSEPYTPFSDQIELRLATAVGGILNTIFTTGAKTFFEIK